LCDFKGKTALEYAHSIGSFTCLSKRHLKRVYEFFWEQDSEEIRAKCQAAVDAEFEHAKKLVAAKHRVSEATDESAKTEAEKQLRSLQNRHVNYPIGNADLYAVRRFFDFLKQLPYLINDSDVQDQFFFLPYFKGASFVRKLYNDVVNFLVESKLTLNGEPLSDVKRRIIDHGTDLEREEVS
jgi:hypothetical protein